AIDSGIPRESATQRLGISPHCHTLPWLAPAYAHLRYPAVGISPALSAPTVRLCARDPVSDTGPILRHRSGPSLSALGSHCRIPGVVEDGQRLRLPSASSPRRGPTGLHRTQFRNLNRKSRKREKRKEAKCFLSCAVGSLGRFQPQAAVSISSMLEQPERLRWRKARLSQSCGKKGYRKACLKIVVYCDNPSDR